MKTARHYSLQVSPPEHENIPLRANLLFIPRQPSFTIQLTLVTVPFGAAAALHVPGGAAIIRSGRAGQTLILLQHRAAALAAVPEAGPRRVVVKRFAVLVLSVAE